MKRKVVALMLSVVIAMGMLSGCGSKESVATSNPVVNDYETEPAEEIIYDYTRAEEATCDEVLYDSYDENDSGYACTEEYVVTEDYEATKENREVDVNKSSLSTFAADVDTASYSNFRRMINDGYTLDTIPADAIRTEEMVNYFRYNYKEPKKGDIFGFNAEISECPWNKENKLLSIGINTETLDSRDIPDCNIVFLVDVSGSMSSSNKLPLIQKTVAMLVDNFDKNDRISIVTYASGVSVVLDGCSGDNSRKIIKAFEKLSAGGSTNGGDGIKKAYKIAEKNFIDGGVNRVIICSDGDFNVGLTSKEDLENLISKKKDSGIFLSTLGFGMGNYSDVTMETLADKGNGNYAYIDDLAEAKKVLVDEMTSTFITVAKDVKFQVEFNPALVSEYRLVGYENRVMDSQDFRDDTKDGGEIGAGHQVTALYEIKLATDINGKEDLKYQNTQLSKKGELLDEYCTLTVAYKTPDGDESSYIEYPIGVENYTTRPSEDFKLSSSVAMASLALKDSEYLINVTCENALSESLETIREIEDSYDDEYVSEFGDLIEELIW